MQDESEDRMLQAAKQAVVKTLSHHDIRVADFFTRGRVVLVFFRRFVFIAKN